MLHTNLSQTYILNCTALEIKFRLVGRFFTINKYDFVVRNKNDLKLNLDKAYF